MVNQNVVCWNTDLIAVLPNLLYLIGFQASWTTGVMQIIYILVLGHCEWITLTSIPSLCWPLLCLSFHCLRTTFEFLHFSDSCMMFILSLFSSRKISLAERGLIAEQMHMKSGRSYGLLLFCHFPRGKAARVWSWNAPPSSAELKNAWYCTSTPLPCMSKCAWHLIKHRDFIV